MLRHVLVLSISCALAAGCSVNAGGPRRDSGAGGRDGGTSTQDDGGMTTRPDTGRPPITECARDVRTAETRTRPVDIVWVIDNSGSMSGEAGIVQDNMNSFAASIGASGIDYHVVVMTMSGFVNVPPPLGTDAERFLFANVNVQSHDGLSALVNNFSTYSSFLRADAMTHFIAVTDDESSLDWMSFRTQMESQLGHGFTFHAIASPPGSTHCEPPGFCIVREDGCEGPEDDATDNGDEYWGISGATGGQQFSICTNDWSSLFASLTSAIAVPMPLPCRFVLPPPPDGMTLDRMRVNVSYTPSGSSTETIIPYVGGFGSCGPSGGWYYEDDDIVVCPATCTTISADAAGRIDIVLGCETVLI